MTISTTASRISYNGNGATTAFSFPYRFLTNADLTVIKVAADGTETTLVLNTDYTVAGADEDAGGTVTIGTAPASGTRVVIFREIDITQEVDYITGDAFPAETHERAIDRLTMIAQQHQDAIDRSAKLSETSTADADTLIANINALAAIEDDVSAVAAIDTDVSDVAAIDANVTTVAGIAANVTTVAGISANVTSVAGNATNINAVAANATNIDAVAGNEVNIDAVAANASNINAAVANETNIDTVAGISANVTTVAGISAAVTAVAADATDIGTVATDIADINTCADNMAAILDAPAQASAAAASAAAAAASLDNFDDRYLGSKDTAPTLDNDGNALVAGALYFNDGTIVTDDKGMYVYDGGTWIAASAASQAIMVKYKYVATAGQTTFTGADSNALTLSYTAGSIIVTLNGVVMDAADYTATTGNSVVLGTAAALNDELGVFAFSTFDIANTYTQSQVDAFAVKLTGAQTIAGAKTFTNNIDAPNTFGFKNRLINGGMVIDQRNAGASVTPTTNGTYVTDRFGFNLSQASKFSAQQSTTAPAGFKNSLLVTSLSSYSVGVNDYFLVRQTIEGNNIADLNWGSANAAAITLSFWVRSSLTGTFGGALENSDSTRCYPFSYTISSANTWEQKTITIAGDTSGTWLNDTGRGVKVTFSLGMGSNFSGTANAWVGSEKISVTGATNVVGTNGATFYITGVQLEKGTQATSFDFRSYGTELALCQRYYWRYTGGNVPVGSGASVNSTNANIYVKHPVSMRAGPTFSNSGSVINIGSASYAVTSIAATYTGLDATLVQTACAGGLTATQAALWLVNTGYIDASAEL